MLLYERVTAYASYGPAFRQTRQHCRRPIIRAAANSTSVHDAAQSWRTTVNWDCLVIRVNTIGKKRYFEERSANVRSEMFFLYIWSFSAVTLNLHRYNKNHNYSLFALLLLFCERTSIYMIEPIDFLQCWAWSIFWSFFVETKIKTKKETRKIKRNINGKNREQKTSKKNNRIAYPQSRYLPSRR